MHAAPGGDCLEAGAPSPPSLSSSADHLQRTLKPWEGGARRWKEPVSEPPHRGKLPWTILRARSEV